MTNNYLSILSLNVSSLISLHRRVEMEHLLSINKTDIALLQETHLQNKHTFQTTNYTTHRNDNNQGVAILIKNNIEHTRIFIPNLNVPYICIEIPLKRNTHLQNLLIMSIYLPSNISSSCFLSNFNTIATFSEQYSGAILGGDLNAKNVLWGDNRNNSNGTQLSNWILNSTSNFSRISSNLPTYPNGNSFLDHFIISSHLINTFNPNFKIQTKPSFADHYALVLSISLRSIGEFQKGRTLAQLSTAN